MRASRRLADRLFDQHIGHRVVSVFGTARVVPKIRGFVFRRAMFVDILKVGVVSCFSPLQSVLTISIFTHLLAGFRHRDPGRATASAPGSNSC